MNKERDKEEICKIRKSSGLNCNGCQYKETCQGEKVEFVLPEDIKPGTKQAKIYWELKSGKTAAEVIKTKEFASESVYIVARKHFPNAISKPGNAKARVKKKEGKVIDKENYFGKSEKEKEMVEFIEHYFDKKEEPAPEIDERILKLDKKLNGINKAKEYMMEAKKHLENGMIIKCYNAIAEAIKAMEV